MKKTDEKDQLTSGLVLGSEPVDGVHDRLSLRGDDKRDADGTDDESGDGGLDGGEDDASDTDSGDSDATDAGKDSGDKRDQ